MSISEKLTALQTDIINARTAITNKGGTVTSGGGSSQLATDIATIPAGADLNEYFNTNPSFTPSSTDPKTRIKKFPSSVIFNVPAAAAQYLMHYNSLTTLENFNFSACTNMKDIFYHCWGLTSVDLNLPSATDITYIVEDCRELLTLNLTGLNNVTTVAQPLALCPKLTTAHFSAMPLLTSLKWSSSSNNALTSLTFDDLSGVTEFSLTAFNNLSNLTITNLPTNLTSLRNGFVNCSSLAQFPNFDTSNVTDMYWCFENCTSMTTVPNWDTHNVTNFKEVLYNCTGITEVPAWNISSATDLTSCLNGTTNLEQIHWYGATRSWNIGQSNNFTESALIEILNNLGNAYGGSQTFTMRGVNLAKLTSVEGQAALTAAQNKGWTIN